MPDDEKRTVSGNLAAVVDPATVPPQYVTKEVLQAYVDSNVQIRDMQNKRVDGIEKRQSEYEMKCEDDRNKLRTQVLDLHTDVKAVKESMATKEEMREQTSILQTLKPLISGFLASPRYQVLTQSAITAAIAALAFLTFWFASHTH